MNDSSKQTDVGRIYGNQNIKQFFELLKKGEEEIILRDKYKDIVLILGNTGSGKSTFGQWITGNFALKAKEIAEGTSEFVIEDDDNRISNSTVQSKTIFPELIVDVKTNTAYYDCPGFSDTRTTSNDISTTFFIKKVLDHAKSIKMIFVVNHHSLRKGIDRRGFMDLLRHITNMINDIDKFKYGIALVATKVENQYIKKGKHFVLVDDDKVVRSITDFLIEVKYDLKGRSKVEDISPKEKKFLEDSTKLIDAILLENEETPTKIGIFRRPEASGPLNEISILRTERENIVKIIDKKIQFISISNDDFGYTISDKSRNDINAFKDEINDRIWASLRQLAEILNKYYHELIEDIRSKIKPISSIRLGTSNLTEARLYALKSTKHHNSALDMLKEFNGFKDPVELSKIVDNLLRATNVCIPRDIVTNIESNGRYLNFLQTFSSEKLGTRPWKDLFKSFPAYLNESQRIIEDDVNHVTADITQQIRAHFNVIARAIGDHYLKKTKFLDIKNLPSILSRDYGLLFDVREKISKQNSTVKLLETIINEAEKLRIYLPRKNIEEVERMGEYFEYLHILSNQNLSINGFGAFGAFDDTVKYLNDSKKWYTFLNDLYIKFSTYSIQKDRRRYNVANIEDFGKDDKKKGLFIDEKNYSQFLLKLNQFQIKEIANISNIEVSNSRLEELNHVLNLTIKHKTILSCTESNVSIRGSYISVTDILQNFKEYHDGSCNQFMNEMMSNNYISFHLFALNSIFIDSDVEGLYATIIIISPRWEIIGKRKIGVKGLNGKSRTKSKQFGSRFFTMNTTSSKAKKGSYPGGRADDGKPGGAGSPGPTFFGIGSNFINGANLTIINEGGDGGSGEDGGDGYVGKNGRAFDESMIDNLFCGPVCPKISGFQCQQMHYYRRAAQYNTYGAIGSYKPEILLCKYKIFGYSGENGGDGGNGGLGGKRGPPGRTILFELGSKSDIMKEFQNGHEGKCGKGGKGGTGGYDADDIILNYQSNRWTREFIFHNEQKLSGKNGRDCANAKNMEIPNPPMEPEITKIIQEYKKFSRQNMKDRYEQTSLLKFYKELQSDHNVRNTYSVLDIVNEFQELEEEYFQLNKFLDPTSIYQSLSDMIFEYSKKIKIMEKSITIRNENKKVLAHLYAVILSKIYNLRENPQFDLIIDVNRYLDLLKTDIENFKNMQKVNNKLDCVNRIKLNYKISIDKKLEEAKGLIEKHVLPEINKLNKQIDKEIDILIQQTIELEEKTAKQTVELLKKKEKLKETLQLRGLFSGLKLIGQMLNFLGPIGAIAGTVMGSTSALSESLIIVDNDDATQTLELPESVKSASRVIKDQISAYTENKINNLDTMIGDILLETEKYPEVLNDTTSKLFEIKNRAKETDKNSTNERVERIKGELENALKKKASILKASHNQKSRKALAVVEKFGKAVETIDVGFEIYNKYKHDESKLKAINEAIRESKNNFKILKQFEENIYNTIVPMLQNMEANLQQISNNLAIKSKVSLDVTKWHVQSSLKNIKLIMKNLVQGFQIVEDNLPRCLEKLEETMTTLIIIYDRIQKYKEQQNLANFIADINSPVAININITDAKLIAAVNQLEMSLQSNIILQQYKVALNAFKQFVFPFSHFYLEEFFRPADLISAKDIDHLITQAVNEIEKMKSKIDMYEVSVKKYDKYIHISEFNSKYTSTKPFYVWKNSQFKQSISEMLSGQEIILKADVKRSASDKDAIKFNSISFNFKTHNSTTQRELNDILKSFKISATHFGNSYYKFNHTVYLIVSSSQNIEYSFEMDSEGNPVDKNIVYDKIQKGDFTLSPYALWKIQLINATDNILFDRLKRYENEIDLELVGTGSYLNNKAENLNLNMNDYYKPDDTCNNFEDIFEPDISTWENSSANGRYIRSNAILKRNNEKFHSTSSANTATGPINYVCHFFTNNLSKFTKMCVKQFKSWLFQNTEGKSADIITCLSNNNVITNEFNFIEAVYSSSKFESEFKSFASKFIDSQHQVNNINTYEFFDVQSNLLLLNLVLHKKNNTQFKTWNNVSVDNAHNLAYNAYT